MPNCIKGKADKLNGIGKISYHISKDENGLYLKMTNGSSEGGTSSTRPIYLVDLVNRILAVSEDRGYFECEDLDGFLEEFLGKNENHAGFVVAILKDIRFVEGCRGEYRLLINAP